MEDGAGLGGGGAGRGARVLVEELEREAGDGTRGGRTGRERMWGCSAWPSSCRNSRGPDH